MSKQVSDPSNIDSQFKNTNKSVSQFKKNLNFGERIVDIKKMLTTKKRTTHRLMNSKASKFYIWNVAAEGKEKGKILSVFLKKYFW